MGRDGLWKLWKTRQKTNAPSFPQFPQPLRLSFLRTRKEKLGFAKGFGQNRMDKKQSGA
jgi:hypothetical protein